MARGPQVGDPCCKAFDSVNRDALWRILGLRGVPPKLIDLMPELYSGTESAVRCGGTTSYLFPVVSGVHQGCGLATTLLVSGGGQWADHMPHGCSRLISISRRCG